jgi:hypothetical protein
MNPVQVHLALNHVPIVGGAIGAILLVAALVGRNREWLRAAFALQVICAVVAIPVFRSGEPTEEIVEHVPGVLHGAIEAHEDIAVVALRLILALGAVALFGLVQMRGGRSAARPIPFAAVALALATSVVFGVTAHRGGLIRHPELAGGAPISAQPGEAAESEDD